MKLTELSVVIPAYNEEKRIPQTLTRISQYLKKHVKSFEIIVVDDGSRDDTIMVARMGHGVRVLKNDYNRGKGFTVQHGMLEAKYKYVLFTDADLSTPIEELEKCVPHLKTHDIIIGSRNLDASNITKEQPFLRRSLGNIFPSFVNLLTVKGINDTQCGFKLFKREVAQDLFSKLKTTGFAFDVEVLYRAQKKGYSIKEVPVEWHNDEASTVNVFTDPPKMLLSLLKIKFQK